MVLIQNALRILSFRQRFDFFLLVLLQFLGLVLDILGIGLVLPVLFSLKNPELIKKFNNISENFFVFIQNDQMNFLLYMIIGLLGFNFFKIGFLVYLNYRKNSYSYNIRLIISTLIFERVLRMDYAQYTKMNSSEVIRTTLSDVDNYVNQYLIPLSEMLSDLILLTLIVVTALMYNTSLTIILVFILTLFVFLVNSKLSSVSKLYGEKRVEHYTRSHQFLQEGLGAIKEIKMYNAIRFFVDRFKDNYKLFIYYARKHTLIAEIPRFSIELLIFVVLFVIVFYSAHNNDTIDNILALVAGFSLLSLRLMPVINKLQLNYQIIQNNKFIINNIYEFISNNIAATDNLDHELSQQLYYNRESPETFFHLDDVCFSFKTDSKNLIDGVCLNISRGEVVGIIGKSGSGKTTLSNLILGLYQPNSGQVCYKGQSIEIRKHLYRNKVGYVPQFVYLMDDSMAANIAFGKSSKEIDIAKVESLIDLLGLTELVGQMSYGINTPLGDRGVTLSGGQIQRLGIARALFINPEILILDEATSALDSETQGMILDRIFLNNPRITIIMITHRVEVLNYCTSVYEIKNGQLKKIKNRQHERE